METDMAVPSACSAARVLHAAVVAPAEMVDFEPSAGEDGLLRRARPLELRMRASDAPAAWMAASGGREVHSGALLKSPLNLRLRDSVRFR